MVQQIQISHFTQYLYVASHTLLNNTSFCISSSLFMVTCRETVSAMSLTIWLDIWVRKSSSHVLLSTEHLGTAECTYVIALHLVQWPFCPLLFTEGWLLSLYLVNQQCVQVHTHTQSHSAHSGWDFLKSPSVCTINPEINKSLLLQTSQVMLSIIDNQKHSCKDRQVTAVLEAFTHYPLWYYGICSSIRCMVNVNLTCLHFAVDMEEGAKHFSQQTMAASWVQS